MGQIIRAIALISVIMGAGSIAANAQINSAATVNVPFSFSVGPQIFEAGDYKVTIVKSGSSAATLRLRRLGSKDLGTLLLQELPGEDSNGLQLVFGDNGGNKYLAGITTASARYLALGRPERGVETLTSIKRNTRSKM